MNEFLAEKKIELKNLNIFIKIYYLIIILKE